MSGCVSSNRSAGQHAEMRRRVPCIEMRVLRLEREPPAFRHGVARVDGQVEQHALELVRVGVDAPEPRDQHALEPEIAAPRAAQQLRHAGDGSLKTPGCW
jgi:hypothetical protein